MIVGGVFFLAPIVALIVILAKAFDYAKAGLPRQPENSLGDDPSRLTSASHRRFHDRTPLYGEQ
jgi:hypothetical protein